MKYSFSYSNPLEHILKIDLLIENLNQDEVILHLPSWRPGRYEIANFAQRVLRLDFFDEQQNRLESSKKSKDSWLVRPAGHNSITASMKFYAFEMDAGNTWLDEEQLYINFINCALFMEERLDEPCEIVLRVPQDYECATGLKRLDKHRYQANSYYQLVDSPLISSNTLRRIQYRVAQTDFNVWIQGELPRTDEEVIEDFRRFTEKQVDVMKGFPCEDYHFLFQCLPYRHYHGVEHFNSTTITIGPSDELAERPRYKKLLGVSCHELFHTWNVIRLRPEEMVPYNFKGENYHKTGFITEGVTTYYGDLFLVRSGVWSVDEYLEELNDMLKRHYENEGRKNMSVGDSSFDLWLDGYKRGVPGRKVSIYNEGALAALILDLTIRLKWNHERSLDDVMRLMWERHGKDFSGYSLNDYKVCAEDVVEEPLDHYFDDYILGTVSFENSLKPLLEAAGLNFDVVQADRSEERLFGFRLSDNKVTMIAPDSPASQALSLKDEILKVNGELFGPEKEFESIVEIEIERFSKRKQLTLSSDGTDHFNIYQVKLEGQLSDNLNQWLSQ